jgi:hypothetical protein
MKDPNPERFSDLRFEDFKRMAADDALSSVEKVGFPNEYREGKEQLIFEDIVRKTSNLNLSKRKVMEIGPGCSKPAFMMIDLCRRQGNELILVDSQEMLNQLPDSESVLKVPGRYPMDCADLFSKYAGRLDVVVTYSVLHYVFVEANVFEFVDRTLGLLADGGQFLIGDIPNVSKRKRFFGSAGGVRFHQAYTASDQVPEVRFNSVEPGKLDDAVVLSILARCRASGFDAYALPQPPELPMANRREDILIVKP